MNHSPRLKELCSGTFSPYSSLHKDHIDITGSLKRKVVYNPMSPVGFRAERFEVKGKSTVEKYDNSLGKRSGSKYYERDGSEKKENLASGSKTRQERLIEIEQRYKVISEKLSASKYPSNQFETPKKTKEEVVFSSANRKAEELQNAYPFNPSKVLVFTNTESAIEPQKIPQQEISSLSKQQKTAEKAQNSASKKTAEKPVITIDLEDSDSGRPQSTTTRFQVDPQTKLSYRAYAARTNNGLFRNYNEDRVSIIQKIFIETSQSFPTSFFALFDGHSGVKCADYLRDNMHQIITKQHAYKKDKKKALLDGIMESEKRFIEMAKQAEDNSGACALVCLFEQEKAFVANVGDSRAVLSKGKGRVIEQVTADHKPEAEVEKERIFENGGGIFRSKRCVFREVTGKDGATKDLVEETHFGPYRVDPGGLSVSRTIGDLQAKDETKKGNPRCIVATPDLFEVDLTRDSDFIVMACDGVFDVLDNKEVVDGVWENLTKYSKTLGLKEACRLASEYVMKLSFDKRSMDNITVITIAFQEEEYYYQTS